MAHDILSERQTLRAGSLGIIADSPHHVVQVLTPFRARYPEVRVFVHAGNTETVAAQLARHEADIGVLGQVPPAGCMTRSRSAVRRSQPSWRRIARSPGGDSNSLAELARPLLALREKGSRTRTKIEAGGGGVSAVFAAEIGVDPRVAMLELPDIRLKMEEALICLRLRRDSKMIRAFMTMAAAVTA